MSDEQYVNLFHHTDKKGSKAIARSGKINQSVAPKKKGTDDARHGSGTYMTEMGPSRPKIDIAKNNYGQNAAAAMVKRGKADVAIGVKMPRKDVERTKDKRDIWVHRGDLKLKQEREPKFHLRHKDGRVTEHGESSAANSDLYSESDHGY